MDKFDIAPYTTMAFRLNGLLDRGERLDIAETQSHIEDGSLFTWLRSMYPSHGSFMADSGDQAKVLQRIQNINSVTSSTKVDVRDNGLCLLVGWCIESVQQVVVMADDTP